MSEDNENEVLTAVFVDEDEDLQSETTPIVKTISTEEDALLDLTEDIPVIKKSGQERNRKEKPSVVVNDFLERRRAQFSGKTRSKKQYAFLTLVTILIVFTIIVLILESPLYDIDNVNVKNTSTSQLSEKEISEVKQITSPLKGDQIYRLKLSQTRKDLNDLSYIKTAEVSKKWPGTINVVIQRRVPVAAIETDKGYVLLDAEGMIFEKTATPDKSLPLLDGMDKVTYTKIIPNKSFISILDNVPADMKGQILRISSAKGGYNVVLSDGITIRLGKDSEMKEKMSIAWSIILTKGRKGIGYIDVSVPSIPVSGPR